MNKFKINNISKKTLVYLIFFSVSILLLLWTVQNVFLRIFYEKYQMKYLVNLAKEVHNFDNKANIFNQLEELEIDNDICLEYIDNRGNTYFYNNKISSCLLGKESSIEKYILEIKQSNEDLKAIKLINPRNNTESLLYGVKVNKGYVFLFSALEDIGTTTSLLRGQLIYITILAIVLAIILATFLSHKIARPIVNITDKAKELARGNYDVHFDESSGLAEIDELSKTLNYMEKEVSKTDEYRRDLMANVSHDLKTPLTMIKAYAEMIRDITYKDTEKRNRDLNIIIDETNRLNLLVNDILELSKLQTAQEEMNIENLDLVELTNEVLKRYEIIKETENYKIILNTPSKAPVKADKKRLSQVMYNLINNAISYTGDNLTVRINIVDKKSYYLVEIKDTGKGIDKEDIENIWDKYYKKEKNHKRNVIGTGLGLSIVKNILENHKFTYGVKSIKNKGTTFYFEIPKRQEQKNFTITSHNLHN